MKKKIIVIASIMALLFLAFGFNVSKAPVGLAGATNFDRIVLGEDNIGTDPNTTADITGQNDEYISNYTNGRWDFGSADLYTTGSISIAGITMTGAIATVTNITMTGDLLGADSIKARTLYLTEDIANVTDITATGDGTGFDSLSATKYYIGSSLTLGSTLTGDDAFTTTATEDTVTISGALASDNYIVCGKYVGGVDQQDVLQWEALAGKLVVHRLAAGESAAAYTWIRLK